MPNAKSVTIEVSALATVEDAKAMITAKGGIPSNQQRIVRESRQLADSSRLFDDDKLRTDQSGGVFLEVRLPLKGGGLGHKGPGIAAYLPGAEELDPPAEKKVPPPTKTKVPLQTEKKSAAHVATSPFGKSIFDAWRLPQSAALDASASSGAAASSAAAPLNVDSEAGGGGVDYDDDDESLQQAIAASLMAAEPEAAASTSGASTSASAATAGDGGLKDNAPVPMSKPAPSVLLIQGAPGMGKTRVVSNVLRCLVGRPTIELPNATADGSVLLVKMTDGHPLPDAVAQGLDFGINILEQYVPPQHWTYAVEVLLDFRLKDGFGMWTASQAGCVKGSSDPWSNFVMNILASEV